MYRARIDSPFGPILLCAAESGLAGLYFVDQKDCPPLPNGPGVRADSLWPGSGEIDGVALRTVRAKKRSSASTGDSTQFDASGAQRASAISMAHATFLQEDTPDAVMALFTRTCEQLDEYFSGCRKSFDIPLALSGTTFQLRIWKTLCDIPYGHLVSYSDLAMESGLTPGHSRAIGAAVGRNPVSIIVPCHRVVGSNQTLTGYTGGLSRKVGLLTLEGIELTTPQIGKPLPAGTVQSNSYRQQTLSLPLSVHGSSKSA